MSGERRFLFRLLDGYYGLLLLACPVAFRRAVGQEMREAFRDRCRNALERGGLARLTWLLTRESVDVVRTGVLERFTRQPAGQGSHATVLARSDLFMAGSLRQAVRRLVRGPTFAVATILSVALGVAAFASVASVADGVLIDRLPYSSPERLVWVWRDYSWIDLSRGWLGGPDIVGLRDHDDVFEGVVGFRSGRGNLAGATGGGPEEARILLASEEFFEVLGTRPMIGRGFEAGESLESATPVVVLSHDLWRRRYGGDPGVLGTQLTVDGEPWTIIGVMAPGFRFVKHASLGEPESAELYGNLRMDLASLSVGFGGFAGLARVRQGASPAAVEAAMSSVARELDGAFSNRGLNLWAVDLRSDLVAGIRPALVALAAAALFLLLILTANLATLQYGRAAERSRDVAVRSALGGSRLATVSDLMVESLLVAMAGGLLGLGLARIVVRGLLSMAPPSLPRREAIDLDGSVIAVTLGLTLAMGLIAAIGPALRVSRRAAAQVLRSSDPRAGGGRAAARTRSGLVIVQVALSLILLVGAGLVGRSALGLLGADPGFDASSVLTFRVPLDGPNYPDGESVNRLHEDFLTRLAALPGVMVAGAASSLPLSAQTDQGPVTFPGAEGNSGDEVADSPLIDIVVATPGYLEAMGIEVVTGRAFSPGDGPATQQVALIDRTLAARFFPTGQALGRTVLYGADTLSIVGVVDHARMYNVYSDDRGQLYRPAAQEPEAAMYYGVRTTRDPLSLLPAVRSALRDLDPTLPVAEARAATGLITESLGRHRLTLTLLASFAAGALLLAAMGIFGVVAGGVIRRTPEIGVRLALGATGPGILRLVAVEGVRVIGIGVVLGLAGALAASRFLQSLLFGVRAADPLTYVAVSLFLFVTASVACIVPAVRAIRIQPTRALRAGDN